MKTIFVRGTLAGITECRYVPGKCFMDQSEMRLICVSWWLLCSYIGEEYAMYYYHDGQNEVGPFSADKLSKLASSGLIVSGTLIRAADSSSWVPLSELDQKEISKSCQIRTTNIDSGDAVIPGQMFDDLRSPAVDHSTYAEESSLVTEQAQLIDEKGVSSPGWLSHPPTPWRRYGARMLDTSFNGAVVMIIIGVAFYAIAPATADEFFSIFEGESGRILDIVMTAFVASILGGLLVGISGFTLGKWIFGVRVTKLDGTRLGIADGLSRDLTVLLKGLGLGIPIVAIFTMGYAYRRLGEFKTTSWDKGRYIVWHRPSGFSQYIFNVIGILLILLVIGGIGALGAL